MSVLWWLGILFGASLFATIVWVTACYLAKRADEIARDPEGGNHL